MPCDDPERDGGGREVPNGRDRHGIDSLCGTKETNATL